MDTAQNTNPQPTTGGSMASPSHGSTSILSDLLKTLGVGQQHIDEVHKTTSNANVNQQLDQAHTYVTDTIAHAREYATKNPGAVLGGLSALVIAAGMLRNNMKR